MFYPENRQLYNFVWIQDLEVCVLFSNLTSWPCIYYLMISEQWKAHDHCLIQPIWHYCADAPNAIRLTRAPNCNILNSMSYLHSFNSKNTFNVQLQKHILKSGDMASRHHPPTSSNCHQRVEIRVKVKGTDDRTTFLQKAFRWQHVINFLICIL